MVCRLLGSGTAGWPAAALRGAHVIGQDMP
jgi:hypothetical protein